MDFVVSKVAMSVCALIIAVCLAGVVEDSLQGHPGDELEDILARLQTILSRLESQGTGAELVWTVPTLPSGSAVRMSFGDGVVLAGADGLSRAARTFPELHAWAWDGNPMNLTTLDELDRSAPALDVSTGYVLTLTACDVLLDDCPRLLFFVR